jgi:hypothetical protein
MLEQTSLGLTMYSVGGRGVQVGASVGVSVTVGVTVTVGLAVAVPASGVISPTSVGLFELRIRKTATAPSVINNASNPNAAGRLKVISGSLFARTSDAFFESAFASISVPQTRHLVALAFNLVPHTGQSFVFEEFFSGLILILD